MAINLRARYLQTNFSSKTIYIEDFTGIDSGDGSNGGYGLSAQATNESKLESDQEIDGWTLTNTRPDGTTFTTSIDTLQFNNVRSVIQIPIIDTQTVLQNGLWSFKLDVNEESGILYTVTITQYIYNIDAIELIINRKFATEVDFCKSLDCACNNSLATLFAMYRALKAAIEEQNTVQANYLSAQIITLTA